MGSRKRPAHQDHAGILVSNTGAERCSAKARYIDQPLRAREAGCTTAAACQRRPSISFGCSFSRHYCASHDGSRGGRTKARHRAKSVCGFLDSCNLIVAIGVGMYFRAEVTSAGDLFGIRSGQMVGQVTQWFRNLEKQVSPAQMSHSQHAPQIDASAPQIAVLQHQAEVGGVEAQASGMTPAESDTLLEPAANDVEHSPALTAERNRAATLASELAMVRRDVETKAALLSRATGEAAQTKQTAEATAVELRQALVQERDRVAALVRELATARRDLETEIAQSRKAGEEAEQLRQATKAATGELDQERNRSASLAHVPETTQGMVGAPSATQGPASSPIIDKAVAEKLERSYRATPVNDNPDVARLMTRASALLAQGSIGPARLVLERAAETGSAQAIFALAETYDPNVLATWRAYGTRGDPAKARDLYARASDGGIKAAKDRSHALVNVGGDRRPASWFGREAADH